MLRIGFKSAKLNKFWAPAHSNSAFVCVPLAVSWEKLRHGLIQVTTSDPSFNKNQYLVVLSGTELHFCLGLQYRV